MQFITSGDRIATENFTLGRIYTVTFNNGNYFVNTCIGIGPDYVMFQQEAPKMLFRLDMQTAANIDTIDESGGGAGTMNYNELENKPKINDVTLQGNKSLSDLGIASAADLALKQDVISDLDTIRSGAAAGATAVQPAALDAYQPLINDLDTIRSGAAAGATAVQPATLSGYQTLIDSSHKLSSDLVDDTGHTNKFATAAQLTQIETNKTNISTAYGGMVRKNRLNYDLSTLKALNASTTWSGTTGTTNRGQTIVYDPTDNSITISGNGATETAYFNLDTSLTLPEGAYRLYGCPEGGSSSTYELQAVVSGTDWHDYGSGVGFLVSNTPIGVV